MAKKKTYTQDDVAHLEPDEIYNDCVFDKLDLRHVDLSFSEFSGCTFRDCSLIGAKLNGAIFQSCDLSNANIAGCNFFSTEFTECRMLGLDFTKDVKILATKFSKCNLNFSVWRGLDLSKMDFKGCSFLEADLSQTNLKDTSLMNCNLTHVDFYGAKFDQTDLRGANLTGFNIKVHNAHGIIIIPAQFHYLAEELGIEIIDAANPA
ncbi:MAG: pentapeptide repeat-containing protein [Anaerolineales bacterium]|nr:pentapeptide repeat-containing protein [Anaerolineales bacterium]